MDIIKLAQQLGILLQQKHSLLATAESCTGGWVAQAITSVPGSSQWFERGFVSYSNLAKQEMLGVSKTILNEYGAVSEETALAMAQGAIRASRADISISITGIAGPDGGSKEKPVGLVWFGRSYRNEISATTRQTFQGDRQQIREQAVAFSLNYLIEMLR